MLNQIVLVGKVAQMPELRESANGNKYATLQLELERPFKNSSGIYEKDNVNVILWRGIAETATAVCSLGDLIGMKGRLQSHAYEGSDGQLRYGYDIIAENVSFLTRK